MSGPRSASSSKGGVEVAPLQEAHLPAVLRLLGDAFGPGFDTAWFRWKHRESPWGPSPGWVGLDQHDLVGVRLFLPWRFHGADAYYRGLRPCDTATAAHARSRGVFRALTEHAIDELKSRCDLFFNTPNQSSRPGYLKMGFTEWATVGQHLGLVVHRTASLQEGIEEFGHAHERRELSTDIGPDFLRWRYELCPRYTYRMFSLDSASGPTGIVYRIRQGRWGRVVVVSELWGPAAERRALTQAVCSREGVRLAWVSEPNRHVLAAGVRRGETLVTHRPIGSTDLPRPALSVGDIEDVI